MKLFGWTLVPTHKWADVITACREHNQRANIAESRYLRAESQLAVERADIARYKETIAGLRLRTEQLDARAEFAETTAKGLQDVNGALWSQNERLLGMVGDMRRVGFELIRPDTTEPNDQVRTVEQDDADALQKDETLIAASDD